MAARFLLLAAACAFALGEHSGPENIGEPCSSTGFATLTTNIATLDQACQDRFTNVLSDAVSHDNWFASMVYLCPCYRALSDTAFADWGGHQAFDCRAKSDSDHTVKYEIEWSKLEAQAETCKPIHGEPNSIHGSDSGLHLSSNAAKIIFGPNGECELGIESGKLVSNCPIEKEDGSSAITGSTTGVHTGPILCCQLTSTGSCAVYCDS